MLAKEDGKLLVGCIGGSILAYNVCRVAYNYWKSRNIDEYVPIGVIKSLYIFPAKSCKGKEVFSFYCGPKGAVSGEIKDRHFIIIDGSSGTFYTARQKPIMILIDVDVKNGLLSVKLPDGRKSTVSLQWIKEKNDVRKAYLFQKTRTDGLDCGDEISKLLTDYFGEKDVRMLMYVDGLYTERDCVTEPIWWNNNPVPARRDQVAYPDLSPFMILTQGSLDELNSRLDEKVSMMTFRPEIVIDKCPAFDEDRWASIRIGDVELECFKPCDRCVLTTVNPESGEKNTSMQPLKKLREFRLAPEGTNMRKEYKDSPLFGVCAGTVRPGYIHEGQVVRAKYKPCEF